MRATLGSEDGWEERTMGVAGGMTERERISYRRGFDDGLLVMRERLKDLLLENARLLQPILGPAHHPVVVQDWPDRPVSGADLEAWLAQPGRWTPVAPAALVSGNGREGK